MSVKIAQSNEAGFSLIELTIAMAVMLIIITLVMMTMGDAVRSSATTFNRTNSQEQLRAAHERLNRDLVIAGDGLRSIGDIRVPVGFGQAYVARESVSAGNGYISLGLITSDNNIPASTAVPAVPAASPVVNFQSGSDRIAFISEDRAFGAPVVVAKTNTNASGNDISFNVGTDINKFTAGEIYFIGSEGTQLNTFAYVSSKNGNNIVFSSAAASDPMGLNQPGTDGIKVLGTIRSAGGSSANKTIRRMQITSYFVNANGLLIRRVLGVQGASYRDSTIAEGIGDLQFRYALGERVGATVTAARDNLVDTGQQANIGEVETTIFTRNITGANNQTINNSAISATTRTAIRNIQFNQNAL